jgi:hypothetical protein
LITRPIYARNFGGVTIMKKEHFVDINGYSNVFFDWGGEGNQLEWKRKNSNRIETEKLLDKLVFMHQTDSFHAFNRIQFEFLICPLTYHFLSS